MVLGHDQCLCHLPLGQYPVWRRYCYHSEKMRERPHLNYWQQKAAASAAGASAAAASAPSPLIAEPPSPGEIVLGDSPVQRLAPPATWAPRHVALTTLSNNVQQKQQQQQAKRRLAFDEVEPSGDEENASIFSQTKKRAVEHNSSLVPLIKEVRRAEMEDDEDDFVSLINRPTPKPWVPLRDLQESMPYPIIAAREMTNQHGRCIILKIRNVGSNLLSEVYLAQRFASCISAEKIDQFNKSCKNLSLVVTHKSGNWSDIKIVKH